MASTADPQGESPATLRYTLQVSDDLSPCPFVHQAFAVQVYLLDDQKQLVLGRGDIPLEVQLLYHGSDTPISMQDVCEIDPEDLVIGACGVLSLRATFRQLSLAHGNRRFQLRFSVSASAIPSLFGHTGDLPLSDASLNALSQQLSVCTPPLQVVRLRLCVCLDVHNALAPHGLSSTCEDIAHRGKLSKTTPNGVSASAVERERARERERERERESGRERETAIWYKDEGGKDHCIDLHVTLQDREGGDPVLGVSVPYTLTLLYGNGEPVLLNGSTSMPNGSISSGGNAGGVGGNSSVAGSTALSSTAGTSSTTPSSSMQHPLGSVTVGGGSGGGSGSGTARNGSLNGSLLSVYPEHGSLIVDAQSGRSLRRVRIHDISKNHRRQPFLLRVQPDLSRAPLLGDIAGADSALVEVRSKRTKRQREALLGIASANNAENPTLGNPTPSNGQSSGKNGSSHVNIKVDAAERERERDREASDAALDRERDRESAKNKKRREDDQGPFSFDIATSTRSCAASGKKLSFLPVGSLSLSQSLSHNIHTEAVEMPPHNSVTQHNPVVPLNPLTHRAPSHTTQAEEAEQGVRALLSWTENVLQAMQSLRWRHIGYSLSALSHNGEPDLSQPLHTMVNPNAVFDALQEQYMRSVYGALSHIVSAVLHTPPGHSVSHSGEIGKEGKIEAQRSSRRAASRPSNIEDTHTHIQPPPLSLSLFDEALTQSLSHNAHTQSQSQRGRANSLALETQDAANELGDEGQVFFIVAMPFNINNLHAHGELLFPAYDSEMHLVGFYSETKDERNATVIRFHTTRSFNPPLTAHDTQRAVQFLQHYLRSDGSTSEEVYSLQRANYDLQAMKQDAMVHYWLAEVGLDEF